MRRLPGLEVQERILCVRAPFYVFDMHQDSILSSFGVVEEALLGLPCHGEGTLEWFPKS